MTVPKVKCGLKIKTKHFQYMEEIMFAVSLSAQASRRGKFSCQLSCELIYMLLLLLLIVKHVRYYELEIFLHLFF